MSSLPEAIDLFAIDSPESSFSDLDTCLDASRKPELHSIADIVQGRKQNKRVRTTNRKPVAIVLFNPRRGKAKPVKVVALLDSGGAGSLLSREMAKKLNIRKSAGKPTVWATAGGDIATREKCKSQLKLPELHDDRVIEWDFHVAPTLGTYDMIIGRDMLEFIGMDIRFSTMTVEWDGATMPFKDVAQDDLLQSYHIDDPQVITDAHERLKKILDAKYEAADLDQVCASQDELTSEQQHQLCELLGKHESLFDGTLGTWTGSKVKLELLDGAKPYHARAFPIPRVHLETLKVEVDRLVQLGVLKRVNRSEWAAPTFVIPKKDKSVRFISDFRELNKRIRRQPYPIPNIQDMLLNLEGFRYATSLDLNMGYYHLELDPASKELCTIVLPFGKFEYQRIPMGLCNSPDIFQEKMNELFEGLDYVRAYIDDLLILSKGTYEDHLEKLGSVLYRLGQAGLKVNAKKSFFARGELEYLGYWITRDGIQPVKDKVQSIMNLNEPKTRKELRSFIGVVNYYRDMWIKRSHVLAPLAKLTSKTVKWEWGPKQKAAFAMCKRIIAKEVILAYPDFTKPFVIHTDASHYQLGAVISQDGKPIAFYSRKLNDAQTRYTTTERELLSIVETLKAYRNILLGHKIVVHTDHKNLVYKTFNTERVMRWRLLIEEFGPELRYIKGEQNIVADVLSRYNMSQQDFSLEAFAFDHILQQGQRNELYPFVVQNEPEYPRNYPLTYPTIAHHQKKWAGLQAKLALPDSKYRSEQRRYANSTVDLIVDEDGKIPIPPRLQHRATEWYHNFLCHPGINRLEMTLRQHYTWRGLSKTVEQVCKACTVCQQYKRRSAKYGKLPAKLPDTIPWHTLCIDLIGPYKIGKGKQEKILHCLTMIDPATGWFEIAEIANRRADEVIQHLEFQWLTRYPWPQEVIMDRGREFAAEVKDSIQNDYGAKRKVITTRNPQANAMVERVHQVVQNMIRTSGMEDGTGVAYDDYGFTGILASVRRAVNSTVSTTTHATPTQLVFGRDALLNVSFQADWDYIRQRKQTRIIQNNVAENMLRKEHTYSEGDRVMVRADPTRKHGHRQFLGPYTVHEVYDNGTLRLVKASTHGAVYQTWNIRNVDPILA